MICPKKNNLNKDTGGIVMELHTQPLETESINTMSSLVKQYCPECGSAMNEVDRVNENGSVYVWYDCSRSGCNGSWLKKVPKEHLS